MLFNNIFSSHYTVLCFLFQISLFFYYYFIFKYNFVQVVIPELCIKKKKHIQFSKSLNKQLLNIILQAHLLSYEQFYFYSTTYKFILLFATLQHPISSKRCFKSLILPYNYNPCISFKFLRLVENKKNNRSSKKTKTKSIVDE